MSEVIPFQYNSEEVRTITINGEAWFVAKDVCDVLEIANVTQAISRLDDDERTMLNIGRQGVTNVVNEPGLYSLILGSRKPEAKQFKRWITHEVIPSIRKTGSYNSEIDLSKLSPELQMFKATFDAVAKAQLEATEAKQQIAEVQNKVTTIQETILQRDDNWRAKMTGMLNGAAVKFGGHQEIRKESYSRLEERAHCKLNIRLANLKERLEESGATKTKVDKANRLDVIESDPKLKEIYSIIVKELSIGSLI
ncbi:Bro-N domain-containing protein [Paenibacillus polysaccharolyticus]|uniref:BRO-N domain-containing protein n=1 Tax=Paenibacillus polysaccharolyticus TaxID=582692 RepID=UPI002041ECAD|nr:Bro-N domain-containing protein [Paenibacillus polysaccharolyticus]MCM3131841.1 Bro-N domain-containing protein [Paenibacillus polysaccharolyticus]